MNLLDFTRSIAVIFTCGQDRDQREHIRILKDFKYCFEITMDQLRYAHFIILRSNGFNVAANLKKGCTIRAQLWFRMEAIWLGNNFISYYYA